MFIGRVGLIVLVTAGVAVASPHTARAQSSFEVTPFFSSFYPLASVGETGSGASALRERQVPAAGIGARFLFWLGQSMGFEAAGSFTRSGTQFTSDDPNVTGSVSLPGNLIAASGRLVYRPQRTNLRLILGGGLVQRGGDTWDEDFLGFPPETFTKTAVAGVVGFGARAAVTPSLALSVTVEAYIYNANLDPDEVFLGFYEPKLQQDVYITIGIPFGGR